jgi:dTDP-4-dehydrorhamnose 3,5-epimerase
MNLISTDFEGLMIIEPRVFADSRGYFYESYNQAVFEKAGISVPFVQDNQSMSMKGAIRGLHFQKYPKAQAKLVRVTAGCVLDVVVDIRKDSPTFGKHLSIELSADNQKMLFIPVGFAHGFATLQDNTIFQYKCSDLYYPENEGGIRFNDPDLAIQWPEFDAVVVSEKDKLLPLWANFSSPF